MKSHLVGALFGSLAVVLWNLLVVLIDYFGLIQFSFYENRGMMIVVVLIVPLVLFSLLLSLLKRSKRFMMAFLTAFAALSIIFMAVNS